jgi:exonuclease SbcD
VLDQVVEAIVTEKPQAVLLAGDLFDQTRPSAEAIRLLNNYLDKMVNELGVQVLAISGNHDGAEFLNFGSSFMKGLHMVTQADQMLTPFEFEDDHGKVQIFMLPFLTPSEVRNYLDVHHAKGEPWEIRTFDEAMAAITNLINAIKDANARQIIMAHGFIADVAGTPHEELLRMEEEGERTISVGGMEYIDYRHFSPFHYVALGHLHGAHKVGEAHIRYSGSLYKYSKSEAKQEKSYTVVELDGEGKVAIQKQPFHLQRDVREVRLKPDEINPSLASEDYVFVQIDTEIITSELTGRVKTIFPNALQIYRTFDTQDATKQSDLVAFFEGKNELDHLREFFKVVKDKELSAEQEALFLKHWDQQNGGELG